MANKALGRVQIAATVALCWWCKKHHQSATCERHKKRCTFPSSVRHKAIDFLQQKRADSLLQATTHMELPRLGACGRGRLEMRNKRHVDNFCTTTMAMAMAIECQEGHQWTPGALHALNRYICLVNRLTMLK